MAEKEPNQSVFTDSSTTSRPLSVEERMQRRLSFRFYLVALILILIIGLILVLAYFVVKPHDSRSYRDVRYDEVRITEESKILTVSEADYYIMFYSSACATCEKIKPTVLDYIETKAEPLLFLGDIDMGKYIDPELADIKSVIGVSAVHDIRILGYPTMLKVSRAAIADVFVGTAISVELLS